MKENEIENELKNIIKALSSSFDDYDFYNNFLFNGKEIMDEIFKNYISEVEGSACCADKSRFIVNRIAVALKERKNQTLQYSYQQYKDNGGNLGGIKNNLDHICYWCPKTIKDTDTAISLFFTLINIGSLVRQQKQLKDQIQQLKSEQNKVAVDKLEELFKKVRQVVIVTDDDNDDYSVITLWGLKKVINSIIKELKGELKDGQ